MAQKKKAKKAPAPMNAGKIAVICVLAVLLVAACVGIAVASQLKLPKDTVAEPEAATQTDAAADTQAETQDDSQTLAADGKTYYADITVEGYGLITVELDATQAPITVENFVKLAKEGFYDGLTFHRIMDGFMIQGGDPTGTGTGGSDANIEGEFSANGHENNISHTRGVISMARSNDYNSASSQFFIVQSDSTFLDGSYAGFGHVTEGMDYVDAICADATPTDDNGTIPADQQPVITSIVIREA